MILPLSPFHGSSGYTLGHTLGHTLEVTLIRKAPFVLELEYLFTGGPSSVVWPTTNRTDVPLWKDDLWKHSCFEFFLLDPQTSQYFEWNFSVNQSWGFFDFTSYRKKFALEAQSGGLESIDFASEKEAVRLKVRINLNFSPCFMSRLVNREALRFQVSAVIEGPDSQLEYWALKHSAVKPDFHDAKAFTDFSYKSFLI